jgi:uncharacterized protein YbjT (DUF2867 family)
MKIAITGANSSVGQNLLALIAQYDDIQVVAGVRSENAFAELPHSERIQPVVISYDDPASLEQALAGADSVIHLAGILIETKHSNYASANVAATAAVVKAAEKSGAHHILFVSVVGASPDSKNAYFRSKGMAEQLVAAGSINASILRTPILLGPGTAGASSLIAAASNKETKILGGGNYSMRPLDTDDLSQAILKLCQQSASGVHTYELVGPYPISYRALIEKVAGMMGHEIEIGAVPIWIAKLGAAIGSMLKGGGITPAVIDVITSDEVVTTNADAAIGINLTPLQQTLNKIIQK